MTSGIRCIYCYAVARKVYSWSPFTVADESGTPWVMETFKALAAGGPYSNGRVEIGYANENVYMPAEVIKPFYQTLREAPAKLITTHSAAGPARGYPPPPSTLRILNKHSLLGPDILLSHANFPMDGDAELLVKSGAKVSSTPNTELQMAYPPVALEPEFYEHSSLGIDCHSWGTASIVTQMNQLLQWARCHHGENLAKEGKWSRHAVPDVEQVFNLGTIGGARAISMADQIGKLEVGMKADVLIFDGTSPAMLAAAEENPVAAIVLHSSTRDLETVIVDGVIRKEGGKLLDVHVADALEGQREVVELGPSLSWKDVVRGVLKSRESLNEKVKGIDMHAAEEVIIDAFRFDRSGMVE